jgi:hypothetical protein
MPTGSLQVLDAATDTFVTRPPTIAVVINGEFTSDLTGWANGGEAGGSIFWNSGLLGLLGTGSNYAYADTGVAVSQIGVEHALHISIQHGNVVVKIGGTAGSGEYWDVELAEGEYSLAFKPLANFWIRLGSRTTWAAYVNSVQIEDPGIMTLFHPWTAPGALDKIQYDRSEDVIFVACGGVQQHRIERRNDLDMRSWGIALYRADDGPFRVANLGSTALHNVGITGAVYVHSNRDFFRPGHLGTLFRLTHSYQAQTAILAAENQFCAPIRVTGIEPGREFSFQIIGRTASTITLQKSFSDPGAWSDVQTYTADGTYTYDDTLDNVRSTGTDSASRPPILGRRRHRLDESHRLANRHRPGNPSPEQPVGGADVLNTLGADGVTTTDWSGASAGFARLGRSPWRCDGRLFWQCALRCQRLDQRRLPQLRRHLPRRRGPDQSHHGELDTPHWMISAPIDRLDSAGDLGARVRF